MKELEDWLQGFITYTESKIAKMNIAFPNHRNIKIFEGQVIMANKVLNKIKELNVSKKV